MSKIFLGALKCQYKENPVDYMLKTFQTEFEVLNKKSLEYKILNTYIEKTWKHGFIDKFIANIFKVNKKGEVETLLSYKDLNNQKLLFHGSSI